MTSEYIRYGKLARKLKYSTQQRARRTALRPELNEVILPQQVTVSTDCSSADTYDTTLPSAQRPAKVFVISLCIWVRQAMNMSRFACWFWIGLIGYFLTGGGIKSGRAAEFYVAVDGNDSNVGSKAKPFATLEHARDTV